MSYTIDIIDTLDDTVTLTIEVALRNTVALKWNGGDEKDRLFIVGSSLIFTLEDVTNDDGYFDRIFTSNETRHKARFYKDDGDVTIWTGHLLPDAYTEPYRNSFVNVDLEATDGLGRLKGKYLDDAYYTDTEYSVIDFITFCLAKTGLSLPLYFTPAIENSTQKSYDSIYLPGSDFVEDNDRHWDCYKILETLMKDMICCVYQADDRWYVDALNKRHIPQVVFKHYDINGDYVEDINFTRTIKESIAIVTPGITMVPPYGEIFVTHKRSQASLPETIAVEQNDGWAVVTGVTGTIYATDWKGNGDYYAKAYTPDYKVALATIFGETIEDIDVTRFISLKRKIYARQGDKISFTLKISPSYTPVTSETTYFANGTYLEIYVNGSAVKDYIIGFDNDNDRSFTLEFDIVMAEAGLLDIRLYEPFCDGVASVFPNPQTPRVLQFYLDALKFEIIPFTEEIIIQDSINDEYTITKEVELTFADDATGFSKAFRLQKLNLADTDYNTINVPVLYGFTQSGINYAVVSLKGANLIADNIDTVYLNGGGLLTDLEVFYNYSQGEQMAVKTTSLYSSANSFDVRIYAINDVTEDRAYWEQWTDAVYQIEKESYTQSVANVYRRMFNVPHYKLDMLLNQSVKFNDIITFPYKQVQNYFLSNCNWTIDTAKTQVTAIKGYYQNDTVINPGDNIPPIVDAGDDQCLATGVTVTTVTALANDPDGYIVSILWEQTAGSAGPVILNPNQLETDITGLTGGDYTFKVTVTDNEGATASDTLDICRIETYTVNEAITCTTDRGYGSGLGTYLLRRRIFTLSTTPALADGVSINVTVKFTAFLIISGSNTDNGDWVGFTCDELGVANSNMNQRISKNNVIIYDKEFSNTFTETVNFNMILGDTIKIQIECLGTGLPLNAKCEILSAVDVDGMDVIEGLPITVYAYDVYTLLLNKPTIIAANAISSSQVTLTLNDGNPAHPTCYLTIEYSLAGEESWTVDGDTSPLDTTYTVTGLTADTVYDFRCKAVITPTTIESDYSLTKSEQTDA